MQKSAADYAKADPPDGRSLLFDAVNAGAKLVKAKAIYP
jgi:hypothetical protein